MKKLLLAPFSVIMNQTDSVTTAGYPLLSVVIPCWNERAFIGGCLDSFLSGDYPIDKLEVIVVDGMSDDGTREIVRERSRCHPNVKLVDNPNRITPTAMNLGVRHSTGDVIAVVGAHAIYDRDYLSECVKSLETYEADETGGMVKFAPRENTATGRAIAASISHPFGSGANIAYKKKGVEKPTWVPTVFSGCFRREVFEKVGLFNEELKHSQDSEFNRRLTAAGGKILLVPRAKATYLCRSDLRSFWKHAIRNGTWATLPIAYSEVMAVWWTHLVPLVFVSVSVSSGLLALRSRAFLWVFLFIAVAYGLANLLASVQVALRERDVHYLFAMPIVFTILHFGYGLGSLWGLTKAILTPRLWRRVLSQAVENSGP